jgi:MscS family membrane protein
MTPFFMDISKSVGVFLIFVTLRFFVRFVIINFLFKRAKKIDSSALVNFLNSIKRPLDILFILVGLVVAKTFLDLPFQVNDIVQQGLRVGIAISIIWGMVNLCEPIALSFKNIFFSTKNKSSDEMVIFFAKIIRMAIIMLGLMVVFQDLGYDVSSFLASLGLIGMALALAAKDTVANLFGSLVIFGDKPFDIGHWITSEDVDGVVESIGIRSTRVRTFGDAIVSVPNAKLANANILNWSKMRKRRIKMTIGLTYSTTKKQIESILKDIRSMVDNHPDIHQSRKLIYFNEYQDSALGIFCYFFTKTTVWAEYMRVKEDINLKIMSIVEQNNSSFAFPTRTLHIQSDADEAID